MAENHPIDAVRSSPHPTRASMFTACTAGITLTPEETRQVSGGKVLEKENVFIRKPGQKEVAVYIDGISMGTAHVNPKDRIEVFNPPVPNN